MQNKIRFTKNLSYKNVENVFVRSGILYRGFHNNDNLYVYPGFSSDYSFTICYKDMRNRYRYIRNSYKQFQLGVFEHNFIYKKFPYSLLYKLSLDKKLFYKIFYVRGDYEKAIQPIHDKAMIEMI